MKKFTCVIVAIIICGSTFVSCTKEEVRPTTQPASTASIKE
jgi:uncharacterized protein YycO